MTAAFTGRAHTIDTLAAALGEKPETVAMVVTMLVGADGDRAVFEHVWAEPPAGGWTTPLPPPTSTDRLTEQAQRRISAYLACTEPTAMWQDYEAITTDPTLHPDEDACKWCGTGVGIVLRGEYDNPHTIEHLLVQIPGDLKASRLCEDCAANLIELSPAMVAALSGSPLPSRT